MQEGIRACTLRVRAGGNVLPALMGNGGTRAAVPTAGDPTQQRQRRRWQVSGRLAVTFSFTAKQYICSYMFLFISMF